MTSAITWAIWAAADTDFVTHCSVSHHQHNNNSGHFYIAPYLTNKGEHTTLYKINNNGYIKTSKNNQLYSNIAFPTNTHVTMV